LRSLPSSPPRRSSDLGAHINPAVTLALFVYGDFPGDLVAGYMLAQFAGAFAGAVLVWLHYLAHWSRTESPALKLGICCTGPSVRSEEHTSELQSRANL